jgi:uncharacterized protein (TIGR02145 family)
MKGASLSSANPSGVQGVCLSGWHLPSDNEWKQLELLLGMTQKQADATGYRGTNQGAQLKSSSFWISGSPGETNSSGFNAFPGGGQYYFGFFALLTANSDWWIATEPDYTGSTAWRRYLNFNYTQVNRCNDNKQFGFSVRCDKDS